MRKELGFTLIELVTVIVLLGIVTAVAAPRFFDNRIFDERGYADELASSLRYSQRIAIASGCDVRFSITAAGYNAFQRNTFATCATASAWGQPVVRSDGVALAGIRPNGVVVAPAAAVFQFNSDGQLTLNNPPPVTVGTFTLTIDPATGLARVQ